MRSPWVLVLARDLLFSSRITETARRLGYFARVARTLEDFRQGLAQGPELVLVDLAARELDAEAALAAVEAAGRPAPVLGWTTHALWRLTRRLHVRCDRVVTRDTLTAELPSLLRGYLERSAAAAPGGGGAAATGPGVGVAVRAGSAARPPAPEGHDPGASAG